MSHFEPTNIRRGQPADLEQLLALENLCFTGDKLTRARLRHWLKADNGILVVAEAGPTRRVAGYALAFTRRDSPYARLYSIAIHPMGRGQGLGRQLLAQAEQLALESGCRGMRLEVAVDNTPARQLYESMGYLPFATLPGYYEDGGTAARMQKQFRA
jgi:ribosomal protein S18 acetylase RimI-like enzyme